MRRGRPAPELTKEIADAIVKATEDGGSRRIAAAASGVEPVLLRDWITKARRGEEPYAEFYERIKQADGKRKMGHLRAIAAAGEEPKHWQARAWMLERLDWAEFANRSALVTKRADRAEESAVMQARFNATVDEAVRRILPEMVEERAKVLARELVRKELERRGIESPTEQP